MRPATLAACTAACSQGGSCQYSEASMQACTPATGTTSSAAARTRAAALPSDSVTPASPLADVPTIVPSRSMARGYRIMFPVRTATIMGERQRAT